MAFDPNLDQRLFEKSVEFEKSKITVAICSYNEGTKKMQISRENKNAAGELKFAKLGRMTEEEAKAVLPLMQEALEHI
jgi:truncated hemoglobin YjbI